MLRRFPFAVLVLTASTLAAQAPPTPAKQLDRLKPFAGTWHGSGTAAMEPGKPPSPWTCDSEYQWVLDGFWLQCDTEIRFEGMPGSMRFREFLGWDSENDRYVNLAVNNMGEGQLMPMHFVGDDKLVAMFCSEREGLPQAERSVTTFGKDGISFGITFLGIDGLPQEAVTGTLKRADKVVLGALDSTHAMGPVPAEMAKLARTAGAFDVDGTMVMMPGTPEVRIQGRDTMTKLFDGAVMQVATTGIADGMPGKYEARLFYRWDRAQACYQAFMVSNQGEVGTMQARFVADDKFVAIYSGTMQKQPMCNRTVLHLDAQGNATSATAHCMVGDADPFLCFRATYKKVQ